MLKELRQARGLTLQALEARTGIPWRTIQKYENGTCKIENMTLGRAARLAAALDAKLEDLLAKIEKEAST